MLLLHIAVKPIARQIPASQRQSSTAKLTPPTRVISVLIMLLAIALTPNAHWLTWMLYACGIVGGLQVSRINLWLLCQRLAVESTFVGVMVLGTLFRSGGEVLWQWGWLQITTAGVIVCGSVSCKLLLSLVLLNLLTFTTPIPELLQALTHLNVPPLLVAILASMYRYLDLLIEEFSVMKRAAIARNLMAGKHWQRVVIGNMIGSLFIRTYDRGNRIHAAMIARGYGGHFFVPQSPPRRSDEQGFIGLTVLFAVLGQALYLGKY
jgi:cobalt/nickel transport system permease protein